LEWVWLACPQNPSHGQLLDWTGEVGRSYYCPHIDHAGRPESHPKGPLPASSPFFSLDEVEAAPRVEPKRQRTR